jgi:CheY-like chemotaxis protein
VKYIANSAAKNISSEDSQMMVPTLTRLGLLVGPREGVCVALAVATRTLLRQHVGEHSPTPRTEALKHNPTPTEVLPHRVVDSIAAMKVVVFSHDADVRAQMRLAIGRRPAPDVPEVEIIDVATAPALSRLLDARGTDVMVLDGEAQPAGGMGVCRQAKDEIYNCPPVLLVIGRPDDGWLATWSRADAVVSHPIDAVALAEALAGLMRDLAAGRALQSGA